jgi:hypothetical protein
MKPQLTGIQEVAMSNDDLLAQLVERGRIPEAVQRAGTTELPPCPHEDQLQDRFQGTMLGVALGDALGRAGEGHSFEATVQYHGIPLRAYKPWRG